MSKLSTVSAEEVRRRYQDFIEGKNTPEQRSQATEHYKALGRVLDTGLPRVERNEALAECRDFLLRGIPCVNRLTDLGALMELAHVFLIHRWPVGSHEAIAQLMTDYHRSGHLRLDIPLPSFRTTGMRGDRTKEPGFLEASILSGHVQAMHTLLELGATYDGDMLELIEEQTQLVNQGPLRAAATQWLVKRALAGEVGQAAVSARRAQAPRRAAL